MEKKKGTIKAVSGIRDVDDGKQVGFMLQEEDGWNNIDGPEDNLQNLKNSLLQKGNKISFDYSKKDGISNLTLLNKSNESNESSKPSNPTDGDDFVKFPELLEKAHEKFGEKLNIETEIIRDGEGNPMIDFEKKRAVARAEVIIRDKDQKTIQRFTGYGDATPDNTTKTTRDSFIRMAETRSIVRALRFSTNDARTSEEEVKEGQK